MSQRHLSLAQEEMQTRCSATNKRPEVSSGALHPFPTLVGYHEAEVAEHSGAFPACEAAPAMMGTFGPGRRAAWRNCPG